MAYLWPMVMSLVPCKQLDLLFLHTNSRLNLLLKIYIEQWCCP